MAPPRVPNTKVPSAKVSIKDLVTKDGKIDTDAFWKFPIETQIDILGNAVGNFKKGVKYGFTKETQQSIDLLEALNKDSPDLGLDHYIALYKSMKSGDGSALSKDFLESLKQYDSDMFKTYLTHHRWEAYSIQPMGFNFDAYARENLSKVKDADADIRSVDPTKDSLDSVKPSAGAFTDKPLNNASPSATPPGALTNPPPEIPKKETVIREPIDDAEINELITKGPERTYTDRVGNTGINKEDIPTFLTDKGGSLPKEGVVVGPETLKPGVDIPLAEENSAVASSPEAKAAEVETAKTEAVTDEAKTTPETPKMGGAFTGKEEKPGEPSKGVFGKTWDYLRNHKGKILGWGLGAPVSLGLAGAAIYDLASDDSTLKSLFRGDYSTAISNTPSVTQPRNEPATNEEYVPGKIPSHIPQDNIKESTNSKKIKNRPQQQKQQPQVVNAPTPVNNATADYVRAAYNSYIPSDAGRAYQKAIYGDPLELDRMRLQQQQQKWRDFVMRSGQSPAELVQRGLMPYDALQYV